MTNKKQFVFKVSKDEEHGFPVYHMENGFSSVADAVVFGVHNQDIAEEGKFTIVSVLDESRFYPVPNKGMTFLNGQKLIWGGRNPYFAVETEVVRYNGSWYKLLIDAELY